jgi:hypothetical protein
MKIQWIIAALFALALIATPTFVSSAEEHHGKKVKIADIPAAARDAIQKEAGDKIKNVTEVTEDGKTCYEAKYKKEGKKMEIKVDSDGKVISNGPAEAHEEHHDKDKEKEKETK